MLTVEYSYKYKRYSAVDEKGRVRHFGTKADCEAYIAKKNKEQKEIRT